MRRFIFSLAIIYFLTGTFSIAIAEEPKSWKEFWVQVSVAEEVYNWNGRSAESKNEQKQIMLEGAKAGNDFWSFLLGKIYYQEGEYSEAFKHFMDVSKKYDGPADGYIADLYLQGKSIERNYDKGIFYLKKVINSSLDLRARSLAARNISVAYQEKHKDDKPQVLRRDSPEMKESRMSIAWLYVTYWMGAREITIKGNILRSNHEESLNNMLKDLESDNEPQTIAEIKSQAIEICSSIRGCKSNMLTTYESMEQK